MLALTLVTATSISFFALTFWLMNITSVVDKAMMVVREAFKTIADSHIDENSREHAVQKAAIEVVILSVSIASRSLLALIIAFAPVLVADFAGIASHRIVLAFMGRWDVILSATILAIILYAASTKIWPTS